MDKNKIIEAAAKLVAKGAYDKAIKEYQKVLEVDPKDGRVLQKMGELYQKKNDNVQAAHYFTKVAEGYSTDGFFLKAVALYKQVLKLNPNLLDVNLKLADLHQQLGLMSEAMAYFQIVANHYDKAGDVKNSLDTLKKMVDLDPENVASKIKLAELYARENMPREAAQEFKKAAEYLKRNNRMDDWFRVAERLSSLDPDNVALAKDLAQQYLSRGDQKRALARLQVCFKADGRDVETLNMLAQAFHGLGQTAKTISVYKELAKVYQERGRHQDARNIWNQVAELDPADPELEAYRAEKLHRGTGSRPRARRRCSRAGSGPPAGSRRQGTRSGSRRQGTRSGRRRARARRGCSRARPGGSGGPGSAGQGAVLQAADGDGRLRQIRPARQSARAPAEDLRGGPGEPRRAREGLPHLRRLRQHGPGRRAAPERAAPVHAPRGRAARPAVPGHHPRAEPRPPRGARLPVRAAVG
ncbi:tetratricopeptide repeat protein [Archangium gephyra]|uniref:tetratricopeptide repeat protein n=1 Tax=Archangium gephyra TaxID=48 RepID=UPI003B82050E